MFVHRNSLVDAIWDEWRLCAADGNDIEAECMGILAGLLPTFRGGQGGGTHLSLNPARNRLRVVHRLLTLWRRTPWYPALDIGDIIDFPDREPCRRGSVLIHLPAAFPEEVEGFAGDLARDLAGRAPESPGDFPSVVWAWLRGLWGSRGGLYLPKSGYYLVFRVGIPSIAGPMRSILSRTGLRWRGRVFHGAQEMFLRDQESIVTFICNLGLPSSSLKLEERAIMRSMRDRANRVSNCDTANIRRTLRVAEEQTGLARKASREGLLPLLPPALRELAEARLANPEASLSELGKKLTPPIQKSTVKYRWARLSDYVKKECC
ncbi:MAG: DNA-binding protein WhiA [Fretibacterium sp.]|nr:DNA-binding protein WhiA [Fretibacterium sp.]